MVLALARRDQAVVRRGARRRAAGRPPRRPARPGQVPRRPRRAHRRRLRARREDPRARRGAADQSWATAGTTGYDAMALIDRVLVDPAGEAPLDELETGCAARPVDWARDDPRHQARGRRRRSCTPRCGGSPASCWRVAARTRRLPPSRSRTRSPSCWPASPSTAPTCPRAASTSTRRSPRARSHRPDLADVLDVLAPVLSDGAAAPTQRFQQTSGMVMAKGVEDCAFYRWARLTSLNEVGGDPSVFAVAPDDVPRGDDGPPGRVAARDDRVVDPRHQAGRGRPRPDQRARRAAAELGRPAWTGCSALVPLPDPGFGNLLWQAILGAWPASAGSGCTPTPRRRCARQATGPQWTAPDEDYEEAVHAAVDAAFDDPEVRPSWTRSSSASPRPGWSNGLSAKLAHADGAGRPRRLPGQRAVGAEPRRPRQPPPGRLRPAGRAAQGAARRGAAPAHRRRGRRGRGQAAAHPRRAHAPAGAPGAAHRLHAAGRRRGRRRPRARLRPGRRDRRRAPGCRSGWQRKGGWGDTRLTLPVGSGSTC